MKQHRNKLPGKILFLLLACITLCTATHAKQFLSRKDFQTFKGLPAFGSAFAGTSFFDVESSEKVGTAILKEPGTLEGFWLNNKSKSKLVVSRYMEETSSGSLPSDNFKIEMKDGKTMKYQKDFLASYGSFLLFGIDMDDDGVNEIILEHGEGKGTYAYTNKVAVYKIGETGFVEILDIMLNGYYTGKKRFEPDTWMLWYSFKKDESSKKLNLTLELFTEEKE